MNGGFLRVHIPVVPASFIVLFCICLLALVRDVGGISIKDSIFFMTGCIGGLLFTKEDFVIFGCCLPLLLSGTSLSYAVPFIIMVDCIKHRRMFRLTRFVVSVLLLLLLELTHLVIGETSSVKEYLIYVVYYVILALIVSDVGELSNTGIVRVLKSYIFIYFFVMLDIFLQILQIYGGLTPMFSKGMRFGNPARLWMEEHHRIAYVLSNNENTIALFSLLATISCLLLLLWKKGSLVGCWLGMSASLLIGVCTLSRAYLLVVIGVFFIVGLRFCKKPVINKKRLLLAGVGALFVVACLCVPLLFTICQNAVERLLSAFSLQSSVRYGDAMGLRMQIFLTYMTYFISHPEYWISGMGLQGMADKVGVFSHVIHCGFQEILVCGGVVGSLLWMTFFHEMFRYARKARQTSISLENGLMFFALIVFTQAGQLIRIPDVFLCLALSMCPMCYSPMRQEEGGTAR